MNKSIPFSYNYYVYTNVEFELPLRALWIVDFPEGRNFEEDVSTLPARRNLNFETFLLPQNFPEVRMLPLDIDFTDSSGHNMVDGLDHGVSCAVVA